MDYKCTFKYSVVIRTLGTSGDKYARLLDSLRIQTIAPKEVIVVMAEGYVPPQSHIEMERIVWTRKGMVNQRIVGFRESDSDYLLVLDDDIAFGSTFVEDAYKQLIANGADCIFPNGNDIGGGKNILQNIKGVLLGTRRFSRRKSDFYLRIGGTAGTIVNSNISHDEPHWCQTANFQCFFIKRDAALNVHLEDEMWLEDTGYALPDDQVFFYKAYLAGYKILFTSDICFKHLDAKSGNIKKDKTFTDFYTSQRNYTIFWYRFLYKTSRSSKPVLIICLLYRILAESLFFIIKCLIRKDTKFITKIYMPYNDAYNFIKNNPS